MNIHNIHPLTYEALARKWGITVEELHTYARALEGLRK